MNSNHSGGHPPDDQSELSVPVVLLGMALAVVMGAANVYVGLKAGMTVSASIPAAVMSMLLFRLFFTRSNILAANQVQTCASAGESLAAGIIFTMPALILIGYWQTFDFWVVSLIALAGGLLGILFMIPMRRVFVVDNTELPYPEGIACAAVLEAGNPQVVGADQSSSRSDQAAMRLLIGGIVGIVFKIAASFFNVLYDTLETAWQFGNRVGYVGGDLSPMLIAVGFIVRLNVAVLIFIGGALGWLVGIPLLVPAPSDAEPLETAWDLWSSQIRYVGVGAMVVGGISSIVSVRAGLYAAIAHLRNATLGRNRSSDPRQRDIPTVLIVSLGTVCFVMLAGINYWFTQGLGISAVATLVMLVMGFFFTAVASYIVGLVGNSNSPVSGMTITAVLTSGAMLWLFDYSGIEAMVATLGVAAVVCCVACTSGDVCNDLKTGLLVGAAPFRQQLMQIAGVAVAAFVMAPVMTLLHNNTPGGIGGKELSAPQASLFANLAKGFSGQGSLPWEMIGIGAFLGLMILGADRLLKVLGCTFRAHLMPIAVGLYLPFGVAIPILIGGLIAHFYTVGKPARSHDQVLHHGMLFSSGIIAGESLTAILIAGLFAVGLTGALDPPDGITKTVLSLLVAVLLVAFFCVFTRPTRQAD